MLAPYISTTLVGVVCGVAIEDIFTLGVYGAGVLIALALVLALFAMRMSLVERAYVLVIIGFVLGTALGMLRMGVHHDGQAVERQSMAAVVNTVVTLVGVVSAEPDTREAYTNVLVTTQSGVKVLVRGMPYSAIRYGDKVTVTGEIVAPGSFTTETNRIFDYAQYLALQDVQYLIERGHVTVTESGGASLRGYLYILKQLYVGSVNRLLPEPEAGLGVGITVGVKSALGGSSLQDFRDVGLIHVVVLSGFNITIIVVFLLYLLARLPWMIRHGVVVITIMLFTIMAGADAPIVRAALMGSIGVLALASHKTYTITRALLLVTVGMTLWNPGIVLHDIAFQLSVMATLGLIFLSGPIDATLKRVGQLPTMLREIIAATLATQMTVLPLLIYYMGEVSVVGVIANIFVLPVIPLAMLAVCITGILGMFSTMVAMPVSYVAYAVLHYILLVVQVLSQVRFAVLTL